MIASVEVPYNAGSQIQFVLAIGGCSLYDK